MWSTILQLTLAHTLTHSVKATFTLVWLCARPTSVLGQGRPPTDADWSLLGGVLSYDCISHQTTTDTYATLPDNEY